MASFRTSNDRVAVLLLDFQNEFAKVGGKLHDGVKDVMNETEMLYNVPGLVKIGRTSGALIIHSPMIMKKGARFNKQDYDPNAYGAMEGLFMEGTWNAQFVDEIQPSMDDVVLHGRNDFDAFKGTELKEVLRRNNIGTLIVSGFLTNMCVEVTSITATEKFANMCVVVCSDGCAAEKLADHNNVMENTFPSIGIHVKKIDDISSLLLSEWRSLGKVNTDEGVRNRNPRILALHGAKANNEVTKMQLENLGITPDRYEIVYYSGPINEEEGDPELTGIVHGPFYSWIDKEKPKSIVYGVRDILKYCAVNGPFDGVYGFSTGAIVATLAAGIALDPLLRDAIANLGDNNDEDNSPRSNRRGMSMRRLSTAKTSAPNKFAATRKQSRRGTQMKKRGTMLGRQSVVNQMVADVEKGNIVEPPFKFAIFGCAAFPYGSVDAMRDKAGITKNNPLDYNVYMIPSIHLIGVEDDFKAHSEEMASFFAYRKVMYLPQGHSIVREQRKDEELQSMILEFAMTRGSPPAKVNEAVFKAISTTSKLAVLPHSQVALVQLEHDKVPSSNAEGATLVSVLKQWPADSAFLREARDTDPNRATSYGDVLNFIQGGKGDLRRLGIKAGEVVSYGAPPGGGAVPALAFVAIGAQTTAAPLAPSTTEPDATDALDQFKAKHLILFEGVDNPGVEEAFVAYERAGKAKLHRARIENGDKPGVYHFYDSSGAEITGEVTGLPLKNPENGECLLLRTSGTTARPKGVPLLQDALVNNGAILAASLELTNKDVVYSVMPLFHIGGISGSVLCTLATGGSVCCDGMPFDTSRMVDALYMSNPQPTWYSSVPTIHNATVNFLKDLACDDPKFQAYGVDSKGIWKSGHSLRLIRSGAAALLGPDGDALAAAYGGVPIYPTYSMSEQMPISQPPAGKGDTLKTHAGSVGMPVAASTAIVHRSTLRPLPRGQEGEIAISGPTVLKNYLDNPAADKKAYFDLTLAIGSNILGDVTTGGKYFLTGDVGVLDEEGFLSLKGRAKELIKKGGEQVSPFEVEEPLLDHPWVKAPICFSVPSKMYGEEVGCAIILSSAAPKDVELRELIKILRGWLKEAKLSPTKFPTKWKIVNDDELPKTKTKKYIRIGLSTHLGLDPDNMKEDAVVVDKNPAKAKIAWGSIGGFRFLLACYVMFMHIGSQDSWGKMNNLRGFPWHVHVFYTLGGYSMALPMNPNIEKKFAYFKARIWNMYPMYMISLIFGLINLLVVCRPSTFDSNFHWNAQEDDSTRGFFCEGTPATPKSWWGSLVTTLFVYLAGFAITPAWFLNWWMGYYLWFSSMYYQCLMFFPGVYNQLYMKFRKKTDQLLKLIIAMLILNVVILMAGWFGLKDGPTYDEDPDAAADFNIAILSFYLFSPFWALYFVIGMALAFLYDAYRPTERHNVWIWGYIGDGCVLIMIGLSFAQIFQGKFTYTKNKYVEQYMRPDEANQISDTAAAQRIWDTISGRLMAPLTTLLIWCLSTGEGVFAGMLDSKFLVESLAPHAYNCFLFHQMIGQWYYAATRPEENMWNWWSYRKTMYWFSPQPCPVEWYEYFYVVGLVVMFSRFMNIVEPMVGNGIEYVSSLVITASDEEDDRDTAEVLMEVIEGMTGIEPQIDWTLEECGLASIGVPALVALLNKNFSKGNKSITVAAAELVGAEVIADMVEIVDAAKALADDKGV